MRALLLVLLALLPLMARAAGTVAVVPSTTTWQCYWGGDTYGAAYMTDKADACASFYGLAIQPGRVLAPSTQFDTNCNYSITWSVSGVTFVSTGLGSPRANSPAGTTCGNTSSTRAASFFSRTGTSCPRNATGTPLVGPASCTCDSGYAPSADGKSCVSDGTGAASCSSKAGTTSVRNFTVGWSRTDGSGETSAWDASVVAAGAALHGSAICDGSCSGTLDLLTADARAWQAQSPNAQGLYRLSVDGTVTWGGAACTPSQTTTAARTDQSSPPCDGYVGQVKIKGTVKTVCVARVGTTDTKYTAPQPIQMGNPAANSGPGTQGSREVGSSGGADGGPATSGYGQIRGGSGDAAAGGTGSSPAGDVEVNTCGIPGQPACKIDETGTPGGGEVGAARTAALGSLGTAIDGIGTAIRDVGGSGARTSLPWSPTALLLPTGFCSAQTTQTRLGPLVFDPCTSTMAQLWRSLLGWLVGMLTIVYAWRSVVGSTGGK